MATITPDTTKVRAGDYIDIRYHPPCPVSIARTDDGYLMTWHDGNPDTKSTTAVAIMADMIGRGTLVLTALLPNCPICGRTRADCAENARRHSGGEFANCEDVRAAMREMMSEVVAR